MSGWYSFDNLLYADFISSMSACADTPRNLRDQWHQLSGLELIYVKDCSPN